MHNNDQASSSTQWESQLDTHERQAYLDLFTKVDSDNKGIALKDEAMAFFSKSSIPANILAEIWEAADKDNKGFLTTMEFCVALKLIACAQHGKLTASPVLSTAVPMPYFEGVVSAKPPLPANRPDTTAAQQQTNLSSPKLKSSPSPIDTIAPDERSSYIQLFQNAGPVNGVLQGTMATNIFDRSNLPQRTLQHIWNLADTRKSGSLNQTEFIIAMHYISASLNGSLPTLPSTLPANIYAAATGRLTSSLGRQATTMRSPIMRHNNTGAGGDSTCALGPHASGELGRSPTINFAGPPQRQQQEELRLTTEEHGKYKLLFQQLAINETGSVSGGDAVHFFRHSKLPEADLAKIWDLADTQLRGQLSEQEFCVAMHLINRRMAGTPIPNALPGPISQLLPSSACSQQQPANPPAPSAFADLLGLDDQPTDNASLFAAGTSASHQPPPPQQQQQPQPEQQTHHHQPVLESSAGSGYGAQNRSMMESNLGSIQAQIATENSIVGSLESQQQNMNDTLQALHATIEKEKDHLDNLKRTAEDLTRHLDDQRKKKDDLTRELQMYRQESKHYQQRIDHSRQELQDLDNDINELERKKAASSSPHQTSNALSPQDDTNVFALSSTSSDHDLFAKVQDTAPADHHNKSVSIDPFSAKHQQKQALANATPTLNRLKEDTEIRRAPTPNVDISEVEAKFPDLNMMESDFTSPTTKDHANASPFASPPKAAIADNTIASSPSLSFASPPKPDFASPSPSLAFARSPHLQRAATSAANKSPHLHRTATTASPPPAKPSKYGFDLSAFEGPSSQPSTSSTSFRDDLTSLFGGVSPVTNNAIASASSTPINTTFDSLFDVPPSQPQQQHSSNAFDDAFLK